MTRHLRGLVRDTPFAGDELLTRFADDFSVFETGHGEDMPHAPRHLHVLISGWACRYRLLANGQRQILAVYLSGDICDLEKTTCGSPAYALQALSPACVASLPIAALREALAQHADVRDHLLERLVADHTRMIELITSLGSRSARQRLSFFLLDLLSRLQMRGLASDGTFRSAMTQGDMADALGLSTVHLNRSMQSLKREGLLQSHGSSYTIVDRDGLRAASGMAPAAEVKTHDAGA